MSADEASSEGFTALCQPLPAPGCCCVPAFSHRVIRINNIQIFHVPSFRQRVIPINNVRVLMAWDWLTGLTSVY